jgi:hypothetical protein
VELVANAWDAYATEVDLSWPDQAENIAFRIADNGKGMSAEMFERRWQTLEYNRLLEEGADVEPPGERAELPVRKAYGKNGRGRHAAFRFSDPYHVCSWRDGIEVTYEVRRSLSKPFEINLINRRENIPGHGTVISATSVTGIVTRPQEVREIIGTRFLADPNFKVSVNGN